MNTLGIVAGCLDEAESQVIRLRLQLDDGAEVTVELAQPAGNATVVSCLDEVCVGGTPYFCLKFVRNGFGLSPDCRGSICRALGGSSQMPEER